MRAPNEIDGPLASFSEANPEAEVTYGENEAIVRNPWADDSLEIRVALENQEIIDALNALFLPPPLTALWHRDKKDLEVIATVFPKTWSLTDRSFSFSFQGKTYRCEFSPATERLRLLAENTRLVRGQSLIPVEELSYRSPRGSNLTQIRFFLNRQKKEPDDERVADMQPLSFFIRELHWNEDEVLQLVRHLNFFMRYFDRHSPIIHVAQARSDIERKDPVRYPHGSFPTDVVGREIDTYLLSLWESAAQTPDPFRRFLHHFQIIEYAAFYFIQEGVMQKVRRILASPDMPGRVTECAKEILDAVAEDKRHEVEKFQSVIQDLVDPELVWKEIEGNLDYFSSDVTFDGGFSLPGLLNKGWTLEDFEKAWIPKFADSLRRIRNGLVHARESRMIGVIAPTRSNSTRLAPWIAPLAACSSQVMLYRTV